MRVILSSNGETDDLKVEVITGDSYLKVGNECFGCGDVFFDGKLIGSVEGGCCGEWCVPEGDHKVYLYGEYEGCCGRNLIFKEGEVTFLCIKDGKVVEVTPNYEE